MHFILNAIWSHKHKKIDRLFQSIIKDNDHKLKKLLPNNCECNCNLRTVDSGNSNQCLIKTKKFRDSFIIPNSIKEAQEGVIDRIDLYLTQLYS